MRWGAPWAFLLFVPWAVVAWRMFRRGTRHAATFSALSRLPAVSTWRQRLAWVAPLCFLAGLACAIVAAARPQLSRSHRTQTSSAVAIEMVVDISGSMEALDMSKGAAAGKFDETRLDVVKEKFGEFVARRPTDLIGLVTFGGYATTRAPLTFDHDALGSVLKAVNVPRQGEMVSRDESLTAIGDGLAMACARLQAASNMASRIVVLLSDGVSNTGVVSVEDATRLAKRQGIKVYTIGVGSNGTAPFRYRDIFGREQVGMAEVDFDERALSGIAKETGGKYFSVRNRSGLDEALKDIDALEKTEVDERIYESREELHAPWVFAALALLFAAVTLAMSLERRIA